MVLTYDDVMAIFVIGSFCSCLEYLDHDCINVHVATPMLFLSLCCLSGAGGEYFCSVSELDHNITLLCA